MLKKDLGLFLLIVVVGAVVAFLNPRFISPINLENTANLVGLFGLFSIGEGFVIITGGIDLSIGSVVAMSALFTALGLRKLASQPVGRAAHLLAQVRLHGADLGAEPFDLLVRHFEERVQQAELVHQFERRGMHRVAAEVAEKIRMFFQHHDIDTGARQQKAEHHAGRTAADDATGRGDR